MSDKNVSNFAEKTVQELLNDLSEVKQEMFDLMLKKSSGKLERNHLYSLQKKKIARINTFLKQKSCNFENK